MALFSAATLVAANPTPAEPVLEARGHGCPGSSNQCAFHVSVSFPAFYIEELVFSYDGICG